MGLKRKNYKFYSPAMQTTVVFDNVNYVMNSIDLGQIEASFTSYAGAGQYGQTITSRTYGTRDVLVKGYILAEDEEQMRAFKKRLQLVTSPMNDFQIIVNNAYQITVTAQTTIVYSPNFYINNEQLTYFEIECFSSNPFFIPVGGEVSAEITSWIKDFHWPRSFPKGEFFIFGHRNPSRITQVENNGEVETGITVTMKAINGDVVNPYIRNINTNEKLGFSGSIPSGHEIEINTEYANKYVRNMTTGENWLAKLDLESTFIQVPLGISAFTFGSDESSAGTLQVFIKYTPKFVAV